jgi:hypothetical protein
MNCLVGVVSLAEDLAIDDELVDPEHSESHQARVKRGVAIAATS